MPFAVSATSLTYIKTLGIKEIDTEVRKSQTGWHEGEYENELW